MCLGISRLCLISSMTFSRIPCHLSRFTVCMLFSAWVVTKVPSRLSFELALPQSSVVRKAQEDKPFA